MFTVSPNAAYSTRDPAPTSPTTTAPVAAPTRTPKPSAPQPRRTSRAYSSISPMMRSAQRTARSASSSRVVGAPKKARTPSPARSLTWPPSDSTSPRSAQRPPRRRASRLRGRAARRARSSRRRRRRRPSGPSAPPARRWSCQEESGPAGAGSSRAARGVRRERRIDCLVAGGRARRCLERLRVGMEPERGPRARRALPRPSSAAVAAQSGPSPSLSSARTWLQREISSERSATAATSCSAEMRATPCA